MRLTLAALAVSASLLGSIPSGPLWDLLSAFWGPAPSSANDLRKEGPIWDPNGLSLPIPLPPTDAGSQEAPSGRS
jgi:hypothetical protein